MGEVVCRAWLLIQKRHKLEQTHGKVKGGELFFEEYGQKGCDTIFDHMIKCATPENHRKAEELGHPPGCHIITKS